MAKTARTHREGTGGAGLELTGIGRIAQETSEVGMGIIMLLAALIGIWSIACLIGGIANSGGVGELLNGYITAVTGR